VSGELISIPFLSGNSVLELTSHNDIRNYIVNDDLWAGIQYTECTVEESTDTTPTLIRFRDADGHSSNIERVELTVYSGTAQDIKPVYFWAQTTSALQTIANRVGDIIALGNNISNVVELSQRIDELNELQAELTNLLEIHSNLAEILEADTNAGIATTKAAEALASKIAALQALRDATTQATIATNQAIIATNKANEIKSITTQTATGAAGSLAQVSYNSTDGKLSFVIPQGLKGDRGEAFSVNAMGTFAQRIGYDAQPINFSYFATDMSLIYFKQSATSGDWSTGIPFGKGDKGDIGLTGNGIATIVRISGTGAAGSADTYRITYTDGGTFDFTVWNGTESDVDKAYVDAHKNDTANPHTVTKAQVGLGNVPNVDATLNIPSGNISSTTVQGAINELDSEKAIDTAVVHKTGNETISGTKTFSSSPVVPNAITVGQVVNKGQLDTKQDTLVSGTNIKTINSTSLLGSGNISVVSLTGNETIAGVKTFSSTIAGNINGNAATASSTPTLSALNDYVWSASTTPAGYPLGVQTSFVNFESGFPDYGSVVNVKTYSGGGGSLQLYVPYSPTNGGDTLKVRFGNYNVNQGNSWTNWKTLITDENISSYSKAANGYTKLANGLIIQWGSYTYAATQANTTTVTFPIAFPTACLSASSNATYSANSLVSSIIIGKTSTTVTIGNYGYPGHNATGGIWIAIGY
jgi:hypothetical protein